MAHVVDPPIDSPAIGCEEESRTASGPGESVVLHGVPWKLYRVPRRTRDNRNIRMTYDQGELEIMSPSAEHEGNATLLDCLITIWRLEFAIPIRSCRTMTIKRAVLERGFEPDNCYCVQHEPQMWNNKKINFKKDPPPDLAIEVEVHHKLLDKMAIYAAFAVPELWCWRAETLTVLELSSSATSDFAVEPCWRFSGIVAKSAIICDARGAFKGVLEVRSRDLRIPKLIAWRAAGCSRKRKRWEIDDRLKADPCTTAGSGPAT